MVIRKTQLPFLLAVVFTLLVAGGCKVGPKYARPEYNTGDKYRFSQQQDSVSFADTSWTYLFRDTVLHRMIRTGLQNNFDLRIAFARINQARAAFKEARAAVWPTFGIAGSASYNNAATPDGVTVKYSDVNATATLSWELDIWGKLRRQKESAMAQYLAQEAYQQGVRITLIAEIASSYFNLLEYQDELQITRYNEQLRQKSLELVRYKLIAGTASGLVVAQAEAELALVRTKVPMLEKAVALQENGLRLLLGDLPGAIVTGDSIVRQINNNIIPKEGIPSRLIVRRPDIMQVEQELISANAQIGVARAKMLPTLGISANFGYSTLGVGIIGSAVANLVAPIFSFGKLKANLRKTQAYKEEMLATYQKTIYNGIREVSDGVISVQKQQDVVTENLQLLAAAQTAYTLSDQLFNAGYASFLDVMDAQRTLYNAQINLSQAHNERLLNIVSLYLALGGGWK